VEVINYQNKRPNRQSSRNIESIRSQVSKVPDSSHYDLIRLSSNIPIGVNFENEGIQLFKNKHKQSTNNDLSFDPHGYIGFDPDFVL
jgi:hypothetical protein